MCIRDSTWAEIDLDALAHNYQTLRRRTETRFVGVVKADAYGHGSVQVSRVLEELGADYLAVSSLDEAMELRAGGIHMPILILGQTPPERVEELLRDHITPVSYTHLDVYKRQAHGGTTPAARRKSSRISRCCRRRTGPRPVG